MLGLLVPAALGTALSASHVHSHAGSSSQMDLQALDVYTAGNMAWIATGLHIGCGNSRGCAARHGHAAAAAQLMTCKAPPIAGTSICTSHSSPASDP